METRRQLTLFVENQTIEEIRSKFNPEQHAIISAHVTLCREDELEDLENVIANIRALKIDKPIKILFNEVSRFETGNGVLIPAASGNNDFYKLRSDILTSPRNHSPHITLMHPRNSNCTDVIFEEIKSYNLPTVFYFHKISLIEQKDGRKWKVLNEFIISKI